MEVMPHKQNFKFELLQKKRIAVTDSTKETIGTDECKFLLDAFQFGGIS
jgi:hypothetical protein